MVFEGHTFHAAYGNRMACRTCMEYSHLLNRHMEMVNAPHNHRHQGKVLEYTDNLLLVGINYDKESKTHTCVIQKYSDD